jgi:hypothetical protein
MRAQQQRQLRPVQPPQLAPSRASRLGTRCTRRVRVLAAASLLLHCRATAHRQSRGLTLLAAAAVAAAPCGGEAQRDRRGVAGAGGSQAVMRKRQQRHLAAAVKQQQPAVVAAGVLAAAGAEVVGASSRRSGSPSRGDECNVYVA